MPVKKNIIWNTKKQDGWLKYKAKTDKNPKFNEIANSGVENSDKIQNAIERELTKVKHASFGKVKLYSRDKNEKGINKIQEKKNILAATANTTNKEEKIMALDTELAKVLEDVKSAQYERDINELKNLKKCKGKAAATFKLRNKILGNKKAPQDTIAIIDPETGFQVFEPEKIKGVSLKYCVNLLSNREASEGYREIIRYKESLHFMRMSEEISDNVSDLPIDAFMKILED